MPSRWGSVTVYSRVEEDVITGVQQDEGNQAGRERRDLYRCKKFNPGHKSHLWHPLLKLLPDDRSGRTASVRQVHCVQTHCAISSPILPLVAFILILAASLPKGFPISWSDSKKQQEMGRNSILPGGDLLEFTPHIPPNLYDHESLTSIFSLSFF